MKPAHSMPFGAELSPDGRVRFRIWAPAAQDVQLCLCDRGEDKLLPMHRDGEWWELRSEDAGVGTLYKFQINRDLRVPDSASRFQPDDVHGPSEVIDPSAFNWQDVAWRGKPWHEAVIYELHVGAFTPEGTFAALEQRLDYLKELGITAVELMPIADFPGKRNWGYDGVLPFSPDSQYGRPEDLKRLIQAAHGKGLMIFLDVVYNHFGPQGNYLRTYAPQFFTDRHHTPWGDAINFDGPGSRVVRDFFIHNALYWLVEYHFDGLRLDAVHAIADDSSPDILTELAERVRAEAGPERHIHLVLENDDNSARYLQRDHERRPKLYNAQWNDDIHHALHVALTAETDGYYADYGDCPVHRLGRCLTQGFDYQGQTSAFRGDVSRGEPSADLPPDAFVSFLQNHDQIGNRPFGERIFKLAEPHAVRTAMTILLLAPAPPLLFMGEEFGAETPFLFFCDFGPDLAQAVTEGRRNEFARFRRFGNPAVRATIPDPNAESTFQQSKLDWTSVTEPHHQDWLMYYRNLLELRKRFIASRPAKAVRAAFNVLGRHGLHVTWAFPSEAELALIANLGALELYGIPRPDGELLHASNLNLSAMLQSHKLPPWSAAWFLKQ